ncbi:MAG: helix-turn-helix transcriptional regulator [Pusillimonas sp.]
MFAPWVACRQPRLLTMDSLPLAVQSKKDGDHQLLLAAKQHIAVSPVPPSLDELSKALGVSKKHLSTVFRKQLGTSVARFLREERMRRAQRLLVQTSLEVHVIAHSLGYSSSANFSNAFRDHVGTSPSDFRDNAPMTSITALQGTMLWSSP